MVIYNFQTISCEIFEIKHSNEANPNQCRNLTDKQKLKKRNSDMVTLLEGALFTTGKHELRMVSII